MGTVPPADSPPELVGFFELLVTFDHQKEQPGIVFACRLLSLSREDDPFGTAFFWYRCFPSRGVVFCYGIALDIQILLEKVVWVYFGGPNTFSAGVWMSRGVHWFFLPCL